MLSFDRVFVTDGAVGVLLSFSGLMNALGGIASAASTFSGATLPPDFPAEKLAERLGGCVDGRLQLSSSEPEGESLDTGVMEPVVEEDVSCLVWGTPPLTETVVIWAVMAWRSLHV